MPANIEIKARVHDPDNVRARIEAITDAPLQEIFQEDIFLVHPVDAYFYFFAPTNPALNHHKRLRITNGDVARKSG